MASDQNTHNNTISDRRHESSEVDYLSYMPTEILLHIFSFLPLKFWIVMCLVSKRWKYFWTQTPTIDLNEWMIVQGNLKNPSWCSLCDQVHSYNPSENGCHQHLRKAATNKFMSVVDRILLLHSGCTISRFTLSIDYRRLKGYTSRIHTWVDFSMSRNVEELTLNFCGGQVNSKAVRTLGSTWDELYRFKHTIFSPKMLKSLTLVGCIFDANVFYSFDSLQQLTFIEGAIYDCPISELLFICPLLKKLYFKRVLFQDDFMVCDEELTITDLFLIDCFSYPSTGFPIDIIAPNLVNLMIIGYQLESFSIKNATNLVNAIVSVKCQHLDPALGNCMAALLRELSYCHYLNLNSWCMLVLPPRDNLPMQLPPEFKNLRNLRLRISMIKQELPGLAYLISCCPNLEILNLATDLPQPIDFAQFGIGIEDDNFWEPHLPIRFHCLQNSLKKVYITGFGGRKIEMDIVKFLLQNAMVLEELNLTQSRLANSATSEQKLVYMRIMLHNSDLITNFIKASSHVRIKVSY